MQWYLFVDYLNSSALEAPLKQRSFTIAQEGLYNDADFQSLTPMELVSKTVPELRSIIQDRRERREEERQQMVERLAQVGTGFASSMAPRMQASVLGTKNPCSRTLKLLGLPLCHHSEHI